MANAPPLRVGQIWQCRTQSHWIRIQTIDTERARFSCDYAEAGGAFVFRDGTTGNYTLDMIPRADGAYWFRAGPTCDDLAILLYDPPDG